jgi:transposase
MKRGKQKRIPAPGPAKWHHLFGAYNWRTDEVITMTAEKKNTASFCLFIERLMSLVPKDRPVVIVMDNAAYHHSYISQALVAFYEESGATIFWLPPYCSDLNPIERFWRHLKDKACSGRLFKTMADMISSVDNVLSVQNDLTHPDRFLFTKTFL